MTQNERIVDYLKKHGSITQAEAMNRLGVFRLAARVADIRRSGVNVIRETEESRNRYGEKVRYARYRLG